MSNSPSFFEEVPPPSPLASESTKVKPKADILEKQVIGLSTKVKRLLSDNKTEIKVYDESNMVELEKIYEKDIKYRSKFYILERMIESILREYSIQEEVIKLNEKVIELSKKVTTHLPDGKTAEVYTHSNMLQLAELYNDIAKRPGLEELKKRIEQIQAEHKTTSDRIGKTYGIGYLKKRKMRKSRKPVKGRKTRKTKKTRK